MIPLRAGVVCLVVLLSPLWLFHPATVAALAHLDRRLAGLGLPSVALTCFGLQPLVWLALCRELCRRYGTARILPGRLHFGHPALGTTRWVERDEVVSHRETPRGDRGHDAHARPGVGAPAADPLRA